MSEIDDIITSLERQKTAIDNALSALREVRGIEPTGRRGRPPGSGKPKKRTRSMSAEGRQRQIEAMKRYWAERRARATKATRKGAKKIAARKRAVKSAQARTAVAAASGD